LSGDWISIATTNFPNTFLSSAHHRLCRSQCAARQTVLQGDRFPIKFPNEGSTADGQRLTWLIATRNSHKVDEIRAILAATSNT